MKKLKLILSILATALATGLFAQQVNITGAILTEQGTPIPGVTVTLTGDNNLITTTGNNGLYSFTVAAGANYTVTPSKSNDAPPNKGISTLDILLIQKQILAIEDLSSPYKIIAADVNGSSSVTTLDIVFIRSMILASSAFFPNGRLWAFVPSNYVFADTLHPFPFPSARTYTNIPLSSSNQNFIGMKLGDVNLSWVPDSLGCVGITSVNDIDGNTYNVVEIGNQCWIKENLRVSTGVIEVSDSVQWADIYNNNLQTPAWCHYKNNPANGATYGKLYNWYAVNKGGLCPAGWHFPDEAEWQQLIDAVGGYDVAAGALKATTGWQAPNTGATNSSGFTALPGGYRHSDGTFVNLGYGTNIWSSKEMDPENAFNRGISYLYSNVFFRSFAKPFGISCRCVKGDGTPTIKTGSISNITKTTASSGGNVSDDGGSAVTARGVCWSTSNNPTIANNKTTDGTGTGIFTSSLTGLASGTDYFARAYATNSMGTGYGEEVSFTTLGCPPTVNDDDGNTYNVVEIGSQCWTKENLHAVAGLPEVTDAAQWDTLVEPAWCYYNNDSANEATYGKLYNWYALYESGNICGNGWHIPNDQEWQILIDALGGDALAGGPMKATLGWMAPNTGATNSSGFTALPGGYRAYDGTFYDVGEYGYFWSITDSSASDAWLRFLGYDNSIVYRDNSTKNYGYSSRCVRDY